MAFNDEARKCSLGSRSYFSALLCFIFLLQSTQVALLLNTEYVLTFLRCASKHMNELENVWAWIWNRSIDCVCLCTVCALKEGMDGCIVLGRLISFLGGVRLLAFSVCIVCLSMARKAENTGSRLSGLLLVCLSGCWLYYHGVAHSNHFCCCWLFLYGIGFKRKAEKEKCV